MKIFFSLFFILSLFLLTPLSAQMSILFVDDSSDEFGNAELFAEAIESAGYSSVYYNAVDSSSGPSAAYMVNFDLVVWHTSTIGFNLKLWNGVDEDNLELINYLDEGGRLWLVGLDFLFDRYGTPEPTAFAAGSFAFDYLGITSYDTQSQGNDGGLGVPFVFPDTNMVITGLPELNWKFPTLNWVDGVQLRPEAAPIYRMGGNNYPLAESICGVYHDNRTAKVVTYFFDLSLVADFSLLTEAVTPVLSFFENFVTAVPAYRSLQPDFTMYPNPAAGSFSLATDLPAAGLVKISILDPLGRTVAEPVSGLELPAGDHLFTRIPLTPLASGVYFVKLSVAGKTGIKQLVIRN